MRCCGGWPRGHVTGQSSHCSEAREAQLSVLSHAARARVFRDLQNNWQAHDAYARACLALGTYKLIHALAYYTVGPSLDSHTV